MHQKIFKRLLFVCAFVLFSLLFFSLKKESSYTSQHATKVVEKYQAQLENIVKYMINESPRNQYVGGEVGENSYQNCSYIPKTVKEDMKTYFTKIVSRGEGSIYILREETLWYWHLPQLPKEKNIVSFALYTGPYAKDHETGNAMYEYQMLYYSDMGLDDLQTLLDKALTIKYEVSAITSNWFLVVVK